MARQIMSKEEAVEVKRSRVPLHEARDKIATKGLDKLNFHYIYIDIDNPDNVNRYLSAGYLFVQNDGSLVGDEVVDSAQGTSSIRTIGGGKGVTLGLVCLPMDLYLQDQAAEESDLKRREQGMIKNINST